MTDDQPPAGPSYQQPEPVDDQPAADEAAPEPVKATTPWFKQKRVLVPLGAVAFGAVLGLGATLGTSGPVAATSAASTPAAAASTSAATFSLYQSCTYVTTTAEGVLDFGYDDDADSSTANTLATTLRQNVAQSPVPIHNDITLLIHNLEQIQTGTNMTVADFTVPAQNILDSCDVDYTSPNDPFADEATDADTDEPIEEPTEEPTEEPVPKKETKFDRLSDEQQDAYGSAQDYLESSGFSKAGLIDQLSSEYGDDYSKKDAKAAVDALDEDWYKQAVREAKSYRESGHFSTQGLIEQLESDYGAQFTHDQAVYGAKHSR